MDVGLSQKNDGRVAHRQSWEVSTAFVVQLLENAFRKLRYFARSGHLKEAMLWIKEIELATISRHRSPLQDTVNPDFETLDARIATELKKIIRSSRLKRKIGCFVARR